VRSGPPRRCATRGDQPYRHRRRAGRYAPPLHRHRRLRGPPHPQSVHPRRSVGDPTHRGTPWTVG
jgi:hypothetical protein